MSMAFPKNLCADLQVCKPPSIQRQLSCPPFPNVYCFVVATVSSVSAVEKHARQGMKLRTRGLSSSPTGAGQTITRPFDGDLSSADGWS